MSFSSNAVLAKARSMYSKHLTPESYDELFKEKNCQRCCQLLKE